MQKVSTNKRNYRRYHFGMRSSCKYCVLKSTRSSGQDNLSPRKLIAKSVTYYKYTGLIQYYKIMTISCTGISYLIIINKSVDTNESNSFSVLMKLIKQFNFYLTMLIIISSYIFLTVPSLSRNSPSATVYIFGSNVVRKSIEKKNNT